MDFSRQLKDIISQCEAILKEDGVFRHGMFYVRLGEFKGFYDETKKLLEEQLTDVDPLIVNSINSLPEIELKDYDNAFTIKTFLFVIAYALFAPVGIIYLINKARYVNGVKGNLREISRSMSSLEFLTRNKD